MLYSRPVLPVALLLTAFGCDSGRTAPAVTAPSTQSAAAQATPPPPDPRPATAAASKPATLPVVSDGSKNRPALPVRPGLLAVKHDQIMDRTGLQLIRVAAEAGQGIYAATPPSGKYGVFVYGDFDRVRKVDIAIRDTADPGKIEADSAIALAIWLENILDDVDTSNWVLRQMADLRGKKGASATRQSGSCTVRVLWMEGRTAFGVSVTPAEQVPDPGRP